MIFDYAKQILNLSYFYGFFKGFFADLDDLVRKGITARMDIVVNQSAHLHSLP